MEDIKPVEEVNIPETSLNPLSRAYDFVKADVFGRETEDPEQSSSNEDVSRVEEDKTPEPSSNPLSRAYDYVRSDILGLEESDSEPSPAISMEEVNAPVLDSNPLSRLHGYSMIESQPSTLDAPSSTHRGYSMPS